MRYAVIMHSLQNGMSDSRGKCNIGKQIPRSDGTGEGRSRLLLEDVVAVPQSTADT